MPGQARSGRQVVATITVDRDEAAYAGQAMCTPWLLRAYDAVIDNFNGPVVWRCQKSRAFSRHGVTIAGSAALFHAQVTS